MRTKRAAASGVAYELRLHAEALHALVEHLDEGETLRLKEGAVRVGLIRWLTEKIKSGATDVDEAENDD